MNPVRLTTTLLLLAAAASAATGCGRRPGKLETPYEAAVEARKDAQEAKKPLPPEPQKPEKDRPFLLDRLIE